MDQTSLFEKLKNPSKSDVFILDIDSTLVTTHQRNQTILDAWVSQHKKEYREDCNQLQNSKCQFGDYGLRNLMTRINYQEITPGARKSLESFWRKNFFSNNFLHADVATRGAVNWVQDLEEKGIEFFYLTARHKSTMWEGTLSSLDEMGFPISPENLFLKEDLSVSDEDYKADTLTQILPRYKDRNLWLLDNEPVVLHKIINRVPEVNLIWFESTHSGKMEPPKGVPKINQFYFDSGN